MNLFQVGLFRLKSGATSRYKVECDALTPADWQGLAVMAMELLSPFAEVISVPTGGDQFAAALAKYVDKRSKRILIVEDVYTTGSSMLAARYRDMQQNKRHEPDYLGVAAFSRNPAPAAWVTAIFTFGAKRK